MNKDVLFNIILYNDVNDLKSIACVNKLFNDILQDYYFWVQYYAKHNMIFPLNTIQNKTTYDWVKSVNITLQTNDYIQFLITKNELYTYFINCCVNKKYAINNILPFHIIISYNHKKNLFRIILNAPDFFKYDLIKCHHLIYDLLLQNFEFTKYDDMPKLQKVY